MLRHQHKGPYIKTMLLLCQLNGPNEIITKERATKNGLTPITAKCQFMPMAGDIIAFALLSYLVSLAKLH